MKNYLYFILLLFIVACSDNKKLQPMNSIKRYVINLENAQEYNLKNMIDTSFNVQLDLPDSDAIGEISRIQIDDSIIALSDLKTNIIYLFNLQGKSIQQISHIGSGPGEYIKINDFNISVRNNELDILDAMQMKIIRYNLKGIMKNEIKVPLKVGISNFILYKGNYFFDQQIIRNKPDLRYRLIEASYTGKIINKFLYYSLFSDITISPRKTLFVLNDTLIYIPTYNDTVYSVSPNFNISPRYLLDFGDKKPNKKYLFKSVSNPMDFIIGLGKSGFVYFVNSIESDSYIYLDFSYKENSYSTVINKENDEIKIYRKDKEDCKYVHQPLISWKNYFVFPVNGYEMDESTNDKNLENKTFLKFIKFK